MLVRSYRTVSPLPPMVAVCFLWHCPASHLGLPLAITLLCEVRTFLETPLGRSAAARPTRSPVHNIPMARLPPARYLQRAKDLVDSRYADPITVEDLAA